MPEREARQQAEAPGPEREARWRAEALLPEREARQQTEAPPPVRKLRQRAEPPPDQEPSLLTEPQPVQDPKRPKQTKKKHSEPGSPAMFREPLRQADRAQPRGSALPEEIARALKVRQAGRLAPERPETEPTAGLIWMRAAGRRTARAAAPETEAAAELAEPAEAGETAGEAASRAQRTAIGAK